MRNNFNKKLFQIGFIIYKIESAEPIIENKKLEIDYLKSNLIFEKHGKFVDYREVTKRFELLTGFYVIIPSTFLPNQVSKYILRIFSENPFTLT